MMGVAVAVSYSSEQTCLGERLPLRTQSFLLPESCGQSVLKLLWYCAFRGSPCNGGERGSGQCPMGLDTALAAEDPPQVSHAAEEAVRRAR